MNSQNKVNQLDNSNVTSSKCLNTLNSQQSSSQLRSITPPKRPAVLCRKNSNIINQNSLLQNSTNKHLLNMPSPINQNLMSNQIWINNNQLDQSSSMQLSFNNQNMQYVESCQQLKASNSSICQNKSSSTANSSINMQSQLSSAIMANNYRNVPQNNSNAQFFQKCELDQFIQQNQSQVNASLQDQLQDKQQLNNNFVKISNPDIANQENNQQQIQQKQQNQQRVDIGTLNPDYQNQMKKSLNAQAPINISNQKQDNNFSNLSSVKQEFTIKESEQMNQSQIQRNSQQSMQQSSQSQFQQQIQQHQQLFDQSAKTSHKVMIQLSEEIERMNNQLKTKNKEFLILSEKYDILLEDMKQKEQDYQQNLQSRDLLLQQQLQISQRDQTQINTLLLEIERLTTIIKTIPNQEQQRTETNGEIRQKVEKLIEMNENLLQENKELGEENMQLNGEIKKQQLEIDNLKKIISEQAHEIQNVQKQNEKLVAKCQRYKSSQDQKTKENKSKSFNNENCQEELQNQIQQYEEEIESIKYLLKEKIQEIEYWKCKAQCYQSEYDELEQRLQTALKSNQILNDKINKFSQINMLEIGVKDSLTHSQEKQKDQDYHSDKYLDKYDQINEERHEIQQDYQDEQSEKQFAAYHDINSHNNIDRYNNYLNNQPSLDDLDQIDQQNQQRKSKYGISSTQYQNRLQEFQNQQPLQEFTNSITIRQKNYSINDDYDTKNLTRDNKKIKKKKQII
ncbi:hypothetical protein ABPG74_002088 [Tetrahymena malaccensis]